MDFLLIFSDFHFLYKMFNLFYLPNSYAMVWHGHRWHPHQISLLRTERHYSRWIRSGSRNPAKHSSVSHEKFRLRQNWPPRHTFAGKFVRLSGAGWTELIDFAIRILNQMDDVHIRGRRGSLHFIRFPTSEMNNFLSLAKSKGMAELVTTVCATGGGAFKFEQNFKDVSMRRHREFGPRWLTHAIWCFHEQEVNMNLAKFDELDVLIKGILFAETHNPTECYYFENASKIEWVCDVW